jgi:hypothetical protein
MHLIPSRTAGRSAALVGGLAALVLAFGATWSPSAHALALTSCTGTENVTFNPGELLLTSRSINVSYLNNYSCNSTDPTITAATQSATYTSTLSCVTPATLTTGDTEHIHWNTGETSTATVITLSNSVIAGQAVDTITSTITSGKFSGQLMVETITNIAPNLLDCLSEPGLTGKQGLVTQTITG